jgi:hypothetical protein
MSTRRPRPGQIETRFAKGQPKSYDKDSRSVEAILSLGAPVRRFYGTETLRITRDAVNLERLNGAGIPLLDSHQVQGIENAVGRVEDVWIEPGKKLVGLLTFNKTRIGRIAEGMVSRNEIAGISCGYRVDEWKIFDEDGDEVDPDRAYGDDLTFEAVKWELCEASLVSVGADAGAAVRSMMGSASMSQLIRNTRARMRMRQRMAEAGIRLERGELADIRSRMLARQRMMERWSRRND